MRVDENLKGSTANKNVCGPFDIQVMYQKEMSYILPLLNVYSAS